MGGSSETQPEAHADFVGDVVWFVKPKLLAVTWLTVNVTVSDSTAEDWMSQRT